MEKTFTFKFTSKNAEWIAERFMAYYWDGGLDQTISENFLESYGLDYDDTEFADEGYTVVVKTDHAKE